MEAGAGARARSGVAPRPYAARRARPSVKVASGSDVTVGRAGEAERLCFLLGRSHGDPGRPSLVSGRVGSLAL